MKVSLENAVLTITLPVENLPAVVEGWWASGNTDTRYKVTDAEAFAKDLLYSLNKEEEDGTTCVHRTFDWAVDDAIAQGAQGIEEHENQDA